MWVAEPAGDNRPMKTKRSSALPIPLQVLLKWKGHYLALCHEIITTPHEDSMLLGQVIGLLCFQVLPNSGNRER